MTSSPAEPIVQDTEVWPLPRVAWLSPSGAYRLILTTSGSTDHVQRIWPHLDNSDLPEGTLWALEVRSESDLLGNIQWRAVSRDGDRGHWREAFRELAGERGLFR